VAFALLDVDTTSKAPVGFSSAGLNTSVTTNMKAVAQQAQTGFGTILGATKDAAIEAAKVDPKVVAAANAAGQAAYVKVLTAGGSQADAAAAAKAAGTAVVTPQRQAQRLQQLRVVIMAAWFHHSVLQQRVHSSSNTKLMHSI